MSLGCLLAIVAFDWLPCCRRAIARAGSEQPKSEAGILPTHGEQYLLIMLVQPILS